jgi:hypothetical protein
MFLSCTAAGLSTAVSTRSHRAWRIKHWALDTTDIGVIGIAGSPTIGTSIEKYGDHASETAAINGRPSFFAPVNNRGAADALFNPSALPSR